VKTVWTDAHASATVTTASAMSNPSVVPDARPASTSVNPTATRLATLAPSSTASAAAREKSSPRARCAVAAGSLPAMTAQTRTRNVSAAQSHPAETATDQEAPASSDTTRAAAPAIAPAISRSSRLRKSIARSSSERCVDPSEVTKKLSESTANSGFTAGSP
jgi:hypothetical protein